LSQILGNFYRQENTRILRFFKNKTAVYKMKPDRDCQIIWQFKGMLQVNFKQKKENS